MPIPLNLYPAPEIGVGRMVLDGFRFGYVDILNITRGPDIGYVGIYRIYGEYKGYVG